MLLPQTRRTPPTDKERGRNEEEAYSQLCSGPCHLGPEHTLDRVRHERGGPDALIPPKSISTRQSRSGFQLPSSPRPLPDRLQSRRPSPCTTLLSSRISPAQRTMTLEAGTHPPPPLYAPAPDRRGTQTNRGRSPPPYTAPPQIHIHAREVYRVQVSDFAAPESLPAHCRTAGVDLPLCFLGWRGRRKTGAASETERMGNPRDHGQGRTRPLQTMSTRPTSGTGVCLEEDHGNTTRRPPRAPETRHRARLEYAVPTMIVTAARTRGHHELGVASKKRSGAPCRRGGTKTGHVLGSRGARRETGWCYTRARECPMSNISISSTREGDYRGPMMRTSTTNDEHEVHIATAARLPSESGAKRRRRPNRAPETRHRARLESAVTTMSSARIRCVCN
ncbi:hypothetical protein DFH07DRAFT_959749 [Mycena maculata]|uniref:Uncharacterized protein n=1 Tax=Mycena maculata TaxID=230809 RepID=A0AAD7NB30_9AGAR|nr:hypothetical protein DFH07DRAFT_959749 [Mycena maculata]